MYIFDCSTRRTGLLGVKIGIIPQWKKDGTKFLCQLIQVIYIIYFFGLSFMLHQHCKGYIVTLQLWWRKTLFQAQVGT